MGQGFAGFTVFKYQLHIYSFSLESFTVAIFRVCLLKYRRDKPFGEYTIVFEIAKQINNLLHNQLTTCITVRKAMNLFPHLPVAIFLILSACCAI
jgi:hypothetical protein